MSQIESLLSQEIQARALIDAYERHNLPVPSRLIDHLADLTARIDITYDAELDLRIAALRTEFDALTRSTERRAEVDEEIRHLMALRRAPAPAPAEAPEPAFVPDTPTP